MDLSTIGNFLSNNSSTIGSLAGTAAQAYGQQNAGQAISSADTAGIGTANTTMGNINSLYQPQTTLGNSSMNALSSAEGLNGQPADYSGFENMPGYQFAVNQGNQAIQRQAASMGSAYTPNTAEAIGQYTTGTAMQDYNTYISQLQANSQLGASANQNLTSANLQTAGNIEQLGQNSGLAQAGVYAGLGQTLGSLSSSGVSGAGTSTTGTANSTGSGTTSTGGTIGSLVNSLGNILSGSTLGAYASGAPANAAVTGALGNVGQQIGTPMDLTASNDAALGNSNIGSSMENAAESAAGKYVAGAVPGLLGSGLAAYGTGAAADAAVTGALGSVGAQTAGDAAAIAASNSAALGGSGAAAASSASSAAGAGAGAGAGTAGLATLGGAVGGIALAGYLMSQTPAVSLDASYWNSMTSTLNTATPGSYAYDSAQWELAGMVASGGSDNQVPYSQAQLDQWGIPAVASALSNLGPNTLGAGGGGMSKPGISTQLNDSGRQL